MRNIPIIVEQSAGNTVWKLFRCADWGLDLCSTGHTCNCTKSLERGIFVKPVQMQDKRAITGISTTAFDLSVQTESLVVLGLVLCLARLCSKCPSYCRCDCRTTPWGLLTWIGGDPDVRLSPRTWTHSQLPYGKRLNTLDIHHVYCNLFSGCDLFFHLSLFGCLYKHW